MRSNVRTALFNKSGVTSRSLDEGGRQERELAAQYGAWSDALSASHWRLAGMLRSQAESYVHDPRSEDSEAAWRSEG